MLELLASKGVSSFMGGLGEAIGGGGGPMVSGAPVDARSFMDGSGWTVSTGSSRATGGAREQTGDPFGASSATMPGEAPALAGFGGLAGGLMLLVFMGMIVKAGKR
jgi:hypothetical protein